MNIDTNEDVLSFGSRGDRVRLVQTMLLTLGYYTGRVDGYFGKRTSRAVCQFQIVWGLTCDGIVGPLTQSVMSGRFSNDFRESVRETPVSGYPAVLGSRPYRMPSARTIRDTPFSGELAVSRSVSNNPVPIWRRWLVAEKAA